MISIQKIFLYVRTVAHLKPRQLIFRIIRGFGGCTPLKKGVAVTAALENADICRVPVLPQLDFCPQFLARFDVSQLINDDKLVLLHEAEVVDWRVSWHQSLRTPLWRFNLHYCEYLLPLAKCYLDSGDILYFEKAKRIINDWISNCPPEKGGEAWSSYTISLRVVNWLAFYGELKDILDSDPDFVAKMNESLLEQFSYLLNHLEKDLLANHYLENLKALVILACYFGDRPVFDLAYSQLTEQVEEQILSDGMHFELSPMYHKIVFEDLLRVAACVRSFEPSISVEDDLKLQDMCDCLYSLEHAANRTPLFNDAGDNVSKSKDALLSCAADIFAIHANYKNYLPSAGYVFLERQTPQGFVKIVFDAGQAGPCYAMGHAHCDALSFECFIDGAPWIVNMGTFAYQNDSRLIYKSGSSHSTIVLEGQEQLECWSSFRVARYGAAHLLHVDDIAVSAEFQYADGKTVRRDLQLTGEGIIITDTSSDASARSVFHFDSRWSNPKLSTSNSFVQYAPDFGATQPAESIIVPIDGVSKVLLPFPWVASQILV